MKDILISLFLLGFIAVWGLVGMAFVARGLWAGLGLDTISRPHMPHFDITRTVLNHPKFFVYLELAGRTCARLLY